MEEIAIKSLMLILALTVFKEMEYYFLIFLAYPSWFPLSSIFSGLCHPLSTFPAPMQWSSQLPWLWPWLQPLGYKRPWLLSRRPSIRLWPFHAWQELCLLQHLGSRLQQSSPSSYFCIQYLSVLFLF